MIARRRLLLALLLLAGILIAIIGALVIDNRERTATLNYPTPAPAISDSIDQFLHQHWNHPLPPQGTPPAHFSALEASLSPASCGACHTQQYQDWQQALHSKTMGPGILWQLRLMDQESANACLNCHAPLAEQKALLAREFQWPNAPASAPPAYVPENLGHDGLACASCHVRQHQHFGPEPLTEQLTGQAQQSLPHNGFTISAAFEDSRFCATCHQFPDHGPRTAGKLREDTLRQWQASQYPAANQTCQSCHMPDRRHQWQGIHSPDMVKRALGFSLSRENNTLNISVHNEGAGHHFPTYMVPKVFIEVRLRNASSGETQLLATQTIGWQVDVSLEHESFDTRIPAGESLQFSATLPDSATADDRIAITVNVKPREHYERTFLSVLDQADKLDAETLSLLQQAYQETLDTHFELTPVVAPLSSIQSRLQ